MEREIDKKYYREKEVINNMVHLTTQVDINRFCGRLQNKVWKPGLPEVTSKESMRKYQSMDVQLQHKFGILARGRQQKQRNGTTE